MISVIPIFTAPLKKSGVNMKLGILGQNISYSLSPVLHKILCQKAGYDDFKYSIFDITPDNLSKTIRILTRDGFTGINVTIPYKKAVLKFCDQIDESAALCSAVNTLHWVQNRITALNTDLSGLMKVLTKFNIHTYDRSVIFGYGGAAPAVVIALKKAKFPRIEIYGRSGHKAKDFSDQFETHVYTPFLSFHGKTFWINATPAGSVNHPEIPESFLINPNRGDFFLDLNYSPRPTHFQRYFLSRDIETTNGLGMLVEQAIDSQKIWRGNKHFGENLDREMIKQKLISEMG